MTNRQNTTGKAEAHAPGGPLILIANNAADSREIIAGRLGALGYRTLTVESGSAALMMLRSEQPGLLMLDEDMPGLSGIDLLREMRGNRNSAMLPVIITTTSTEPAIAAAAFNAGADDHVVMPCDFRMLSARIERQLNRAREMADLRQAVAALDARLIRRTLENDELLVRIETLTAEKTALAALRLAGNVQPSSSPVKSIAAI